jgi:hypothetical protein
MAAGNLNLLIPVLLPSIKFFGLSIGNMLDWSNCKPDQLVQYQGLAKKSDDSLVCGIPKVPCKYNYLKIGFS